MENPDLENIENLKSNFVGYEKWDKMYTPDPLYPNQKIELKDCSDIDLETFTDDDELELLAYIWGDHLDYIENRRLTAFELMIHKKEKQQRELLLQKNEQIGTIKKEDFIPFCEWKDQTEKKS